MLNKQNFCWLKQRPELCVGNICILWSQIIPYISETITEGVTGYSSPEAVDDVGVMGVEVSRQGTPQGHRQSDGPVRRVVDPRPGGEDGARHQDDSVEVRLSDHGAVHQVLHTGRPHTLQQCNIIFSSGLQSGNKKNLLIFQNLL